jgi:hypothetical protein
MIRPAIAAGCLLLGAAGAYAQTPDTDIYLAPLRLKDGWVAVGAPRNITERKGYDNQPYFTADGRAILFTARIDDRQTDIFRYDLRSGKTVRLTDTPESEYSPTPAKGGFSVVRVERDSVQRLWWFDNQGRNPKLLLASVKPVGYHAWVGAQQLALFVLGTPATLQVASLSAAQPRVVAQDVGRALQKIPNWNGVSFVQRMNDSTAWIERVGSDEKVRRIAKLLPGAEYHAWTRKGALLGTAGSKLYEWTPIDGGTWRLVLDLAPRGLTLSRIAVSPRGDWIALVAERSQ